MKLELKNLRKQAGFTQDQMAELLGIKKRTYGSWERGEAMMNLEQAYNCAVILGCTLNDLVGMKASRSYADHRQTAINGHFESFNDSGKTELATITERMSHDPSIRIQKDGTKNDSYHEALGA